MKKSFKLRKAQELDSEVSAHPEDTNFDPTTANSVVGELAEKVRGFLAKDHKAKPPGLETITEHGGAMVVRADNPEVGLGVEVRISLLAPQTPEPADVPLAPPPVDLGTQGMGSQPGAGPVLEGGMGIGPTL